MTDMRHHRRSVTGHKIQVIAVENDDFSLMRLITRFGLVTTIIRKENVGPFKKGFTKIEFFHQGQLYSHFYDYAMSARTAKKQAAQMAEDVTEGRWLV